MKTKVNVGCGLCAGPSWINIDGSWNSWFANYPWLARLLTPVIGSGWRSWPKGIVYGNLSTGEIPQPDAIADCVFASHFFEHLTRTEGCHFLKECLRVLKPGGKIRIIVPDLEGAARCYLRELELEVKAGRSQNKQCSGDKFMGGLFVCGPRRRWWVPADWYQAFHDYHRHFWMYDRQSLAAVAADAGFCEIKVGVAREKSEAPDIAEVERNEATGEDGLGFSLEGTKPYRL